MATLTSKKTTRVCGRAYRQSIIAGIDRYPFITNIGFAYQLAERNALNAPSLRIVEFNRGQCLPDAYPSNTQNCIILETHGYLHGGSIGQPWHGRSCPPGSHLRRYVSRWITMSLTALHSAMNRLPVVVGHAIQSAFALFADQWVSRQRLEFAVMRTTRSPYQWLVLKIIGYHRHASEGWQKALSREQYHLSPTAPRRQSR